MLFSDLGKITVGHSQLKVDHEIRRFETDSRHLDGQIGSVFVAISTSSGNGHHYIQEAYEKGIRSFILQEKNSIKDANFLLVKDSVKALQEIAAFHRKQFNYPVIGITGSNGKTTVKEWLSTILSERLNTIKSPKSFNSQLGVPLSIMEMNKAHDIGVFEAGISTKGEMSALEKILRPEIGIFTTLGVAHDDGFQSREEKLREKLTLFQHSQKVICRNDVSWYGTVLETLNLDQLATWSLNKDSDFIVKWSDGNILINDWNFGSELSHTADLENITHAIIAALNLNLTHDEIQAGLDKIRRVPMRLEFKRGVNGSFLLDDTYNNDLVGLKAALDHLDGQKQQTNKTVILSDILHSSDTDQTLYREVNKLLTSKRVNRLIGIGPRISHAKHLFQIETQMFESTDDAIHHLPEINNEMVLIKGARDFKLERIVKELEEKRHGTILEVSFEALRHNLSEYKKLLKPSTKLMVMVKANAYGSGILEVANFLQHHRVDYLGVAYLDEAIALRRNGISIPIMIMNPYIESFAPFEKYRLEPEIFSLGHLSRYIDDTRYPLAIHLKVDTGMHRLGFQKREIPSLLQKLKEAPQIKVASIFTHFASADNTNDDDFTKDQAILFENIYDEIVAFLGYKPIAHACNSPAIVRWPEYQYDMVRLGIGLHGYDPTHQLNLRPASRLKSIVSQIQELEKGESIGYSRKGKLKKDSRIAIIPIGYEDGFSRIFGNGNAEVIINQNRCKTIGNVCMDMMMVDVTGKSVKEGDEVIVFGNDPSIEYLARAANTIPYEILTNISSRVKRVFISE